MLPIPPSLTQHCFFILLSSLLLLGRPCTLQAEKVDFKQCHASWSETELVLSNAHFERRWLLGDNGLLTATSFRNLKTGTEWIREPTKTPAPIPANLAKEKRALSITSRSGQLTTTGEEGLEITLTSKGISGTESMICKFRVYPNASGVETTFAPGSHTAFSLKASLYQKSSSAPSVTGLEASLQKTEGSAGDALENLMLSPRHLRLIQVIFRDQTDANNELVQENEWMLLNENNLKLSGNLFAVEDPLTGEGLVFLKLAPLPHARSFPSDEDCIVSAHHRQVSFTGQGYPFVLLTYSGGRTGRTAVLHDLQRELRTYDPHRDGMFLSNTWGDRSQDGKVSEAFLLKEIDAGSKMGVDVVQIDDGWQKGVSGNSSLAKNGKKGTWGNFWDAGNDFWDANPTRFPHGLNPVAKAARDHGIKLGLWYGPDTSHDGINWKRDAELLMKLHRDNGINYFKFDAIDISRPDSEKNFRRLVDQLIDQSKGEIAIDFDVTAGARAGYFGMPAQGPIFVENRYTDFPNYWPHLTLRNLWMLSQYIDPIRLRMEILNNTRNTEKYGDDPLAPAMYAPDALFASVMFANPLGWFEISNLPENYRESVSKLLAIWKKERSQLFSGQILPIGEAPDGNAWTGFASVPRNDGPGYLLLFRELNPSPTWSIDLNLFPASKRKVSVLAGKGDAHIEGNKLTVSIPEKLQYLFLKLE